MIGIKKYLSIGRFFNKMSLHLFHKIFVGFQTDSKNIFKTRITYLSYLNNRLQKEGGYFIFLP